MKQTHSDKTKTREAMPEEMDYSGMAPLKLDVEKYRDELKDFDMTIEQQNEFLEILWHILRTFVELGWGVDNIQMFSNQNNDKYRSDSVKVLKRNTSTKSFNQVTNPKNK
ncbi:MAG: hypothetical protein QM500_15935 [Methylococcales bacterium]